MTDVAEMQAIKVHVTGSDVPLVPKVDPPCPYRTSNRTVQLSAGNPIVLTGYDPLREQLLLLVVAGPVILCDSVGDSSAAENNTGTAGTYVAPRGALLPQSNNQYVIPGPDALWLATNSVAAQVSVTTVRKTIR